MPEGSRRSRNDPQPFVPYEVEGDSAPDDEEWKCPLCGHVQPLGAIMRCDECGQVPGVITSAKAKGKVAWIGRHR